MSDVDGHLISGSFTFDVGVGGATSTEAAANAVPGPQPSDIAIGVVKWVEALALLFLAGQVLVSTPRQAIPALDLGDASIPRLEHRPLGRAGRRLVGGHGRLRWPQPRQLPGVLQRALGCRVDRAARCLRRWRSSPWCEVGEACPFGSAGALVLLAASGHAAGVDPAWYGIGLDAVHLIAAGLWAGGIAAWPCSSPRGLAFERWAALLAGSPRWRWGLSG